MATFQYNMDGSNRPPVVRRMSVAASQTIARGDVLDLSSGDVARASTATGRVVGVAAEAVTSAASGNFFVQVYIATPTQVWQHVTSASAATLILNGTRSYDFNASNQINVADSSGGSVQFVGPGSATTMPDITFANCVFA